MQATGAEEDLVVFYYSGTSLAETEARGGDRRLFLFLADSVPDQQESALEISDLSAGLRGIRAHHALAMLDTCYGTSGLPEPPGATVLSRESDPSLPVLQFFAASGNDEYAMESPELGGGAFTQSLIRVLSETLNANRGAWMHDVVAKTTARIRMGPQHYPIPKILTVSGQGEIYWSKEASETR